MTLNLTPPIQYMSTDISMHCITFAVMRKHIGLIMMQHNWQCHIYD